MTAPDFSKIWAENTPLTPYVFKDSDYLEGWEFLGEIPPDRRMFDTWQKQADTKMLWLKNNMLGYLLRQNSTKYQAGDIAFSPSLPSYLVLLCSESGTTAATEPDFSEAEEDETVTDGTVVWTYKGLLSDDGANTDLSNLTATGEARFAHVVVDSYYDSTTGDWWRQYEDGWIEQGGQYVSNTASYAFDTTITFLKPFADTAYSMQVTGIGSDSGTVPTGAGISGYAAKTTTTARIGINAISSSYSWNIGMAWVACGMGASA